MNFLSGALPLSWNSNRFVVVECIAVDVICIYTDAYWTQGFPVIIQRQHDEAARRVTGDHATEQQSIRLIQDKFSVCYRQKKIPMYLKA
jgi:hypothetical protein